MRSAMARLRVPTSSRIPSPRGGRLCRGGAGCRGQLVHQAVHDHRRRGRARGDRVRHGRHPPGGVAGEPDRPILARAQPLGEVRALLQRRRDEQPLAAPLATVGEDDRDSTSPAPRSSATGRSSTCTPAARRRSASSSPSSAGPAANSVTSSLHRRRIARSRPALRRAAERPVAHLPAVAERAGKTERPHSSAAQPRGQL